MYNEATHSNCLLCTWYARNDNIKLSDNFWVYIWQTCFDLAASLVAVRYQTRLNGSIKRGHSEAPENTTHWPNDVSMLGQCPRHWPSIETSLIVLNLVGHFAVQILWWGVILLALLLTSGMLWTDRCIHISRIWSVLRVLSLTLTSRVRSTYTAIWDAKHPETVNSN